MKPIMATPTGAATVSERGPGMRGHSTEPAAAPIEHRIVTGVDIAVAWTTALFLLMGATLLPALG